MPTFKDKKDREWIIDLPWATVRRLKSQNSIDLLTFAEDNFAKFRAVSQNPIEFLDLLWILIKPQAEKLNVTQEDFEEHLHGDEMHAAREGFSAAYLDFIPDPKIRSALERILKKQKQMIDETMEQATRMAEAKMDEMKLTDDQLQQTVNEAIAEQRSIAQQRQSAPSGVLQAT